MGASVLNCVKNGGFLGGEGGGSEEFTLQDECMGFCTAYFDTVTPI